MDDMRILERDEGFSRILRRIELKGLTRKERRAMERRWRKEHHRAVPSPSAIFRYLEVSLTLIGIDPPLLRKADPPIRYGGSFAL